MNHKYLNNKILCNISYSFLLFFAIVFFILYAKNNYARDLSHVNFSIESNKTEPNDAVVEDTENLKKIGKEHSEKYCAYNGTKYPDDFDFTYYDVTGLTHKMKIDKLAAFNNIIWNKKHKANEKGEPYNCDLYYGVDVSRHNGDINWKEVKNAGIDFAFIRIVYRGYGQKGTLREDELAVKNLINAKAAGLKIGAYIFSQSINKNETIEEATLAIKILNDNNIKLDLPLVYDPETIRNDIARTDDINGNIFTENAITFCEYVKSHNFTPAIYSNMIWEDYYFDMSKLSKYDIWYADYEDFPQTPYRYKYWQFSEYGKVPGITGLVDLNVMVEKNEL